MAKNDLWIGKRRIGSSTPVFIIAEAGVNHNGDLETALRLVDVAADAGADAVKFQTFRADEVAIPAARMAAYQRKNLGIDEDQRAMLAKLELKEEFYAPIIAQCKARNIMFLSTPHGGFASVDFLQSLGVPAFKFGSGDLTNLPVLEYAARLKKPMIVSTGMATLAEVREAVECIRKAGNRKIVILHCTTNYPCVLEDVHLRAMRAMGEKLGVLTGYSDHTREAHVSCAASVLGAAIIEKHFTLDRTMVGPDHVASMEPEELKQMIGWVRDADIFMGRPEKRVTPAERLHRPVARKSIVTACDIKKGTVVTPALLAIKRPGTGMAPKFYHSMIGLRVRRDLKKDSLVRRSDFT